jgi:L-fuculose-phosphate aldolase
MTPRRTLVDAYCALGAAGMIAGSAGNVSLRDGTGTPDGTGMLISPTGTTPERISPDALVAIGFDAPAPGASSEWALHGGLYQARPEFNAIVHTHADACTALACLGEDLPAFHYEILAFGGDSVRCAPYVTFGTPELAALAVQAMAGRSACLLGNHGMIAAGATLEKAMAHAFHLERLCRQYLMARAAGRPRLLTAAQIADAQERFRSYHRPASG